jgi:Domain of unknown function (DUF4062)
VAAEIVAVIAGGWQVDTEETGSPVWLSAGPGGVQDSRPGDGNEQNHHAGLVSTEAMGAASVAGRTGERVRRAPWRVFVSHTGELAQFPEGNSFVAAAKHAVDRAGHVAVEMDTWTATSLPPTQVCVERVLACDVYVGLLGFQYGSLVRDDPSVS